MISGTFLSHSLEEKNEYVCDKIFISLGLLLFHSKTLLKHIILKKTLHKYRHDRQSFLLE